MRSGGSWHTLSTDFFLLSPLSTYLSPLSLGMNLDLLEWTLTLTVERPPSQQESTIVYSKAKPNKLLWTHPKLRQEILFRQELLILFQNIGQIRSLSLNRKLSKLGTYSFWQSWVVAQSQKEQKTSAASSSLSVLCSPRDRKIDQLVTT